jgi:hypothetical protein
MSKEINLLASQFVGFTEPRLMKRLNILNSIITDKDALDEEIADAALKRKEVKELLSVFAMVRSVGVDPDGMTAFEVIDTVTKATTGRSAEQLVKQTTGGAMGQALVEKTSGAVKRTKEVTKKASGGLGAWLMKWSQGQ